MEWIIGKVVNLATVEMNEMVHVEEVDYKNRIVKYYRLGSTLLEKNHIADILEVELTNE